MVVVLTLVIIQRWSLHRFDFIYKLFLKKSLRTNYRFLHGGWKLPSFKLQKSNIKIIETRKFPYSILSLFY